MTEIERKALALFNEVARERGSSCDSVLLDRAFAENEALCRAIEQHEEFRREVSEAVEQRFNHNSLAYGCLDRFILPKPVDPLVEAMSEAMCGVPGEDYTQPAKDLREAMMARGYKWTKIGDADNG